MGQDITVDDLKVTAIFMREPQDWVHIEIVGQVPVAEWRKLEDALEERTGSITLRWTDERDWSAFVAH